MPDEEYSLNYIDRKMSLIDKGTRFQFLGDFQEYLQDGLSAVNYSIEKYANDADVARKKRLEAALMLLRVYQEKMADWDGKKWAFNAMLDKCEPDPKVIADIRNDRILAARNAKINKIQATVEGSDQKLMGGDSSINGPEPDHTNDGPVCD